MSGAFLHLGESPADPVSWLDPDGHPGTGDLDAAAAALGARECVVFAPGQRCLLTRAPVPSRNRAHQARAVPYALEDDLSSDVEGLHFALGPHRDGQVAVAVVARDWLEAWRAALDEAGLQASGIFPDLLALPWDGERWTLADNGAAVLVRTGAHSGFAADPATLRSLIAAALEEEDEDASPERLRVLPTPSAGDAPAALPLPRDLESSPRPLLQWLAAGHQPATSIDLLQGAFDRSSEGTDPWRPWQPVAAMGLLLLAVAGAFQVAEYVRIRDESAALEQRIATLYRQAFPDARSVIKPRFRTERLLAELRAGGAGEGGLLRLLGSAAGPLAEARETRVRGLSFRNDNLYVDLQVPALQTLDRLKQAIAAAGGVEVTIQTATARDGGVESRLQIREARG